MNYEFPDDLVALRSRLRSRITETFPDGFPTIFTEDPQPLAASHEFCRQLGSEGTLTIAWPAEYGGENASLWAQLVVAEEMWAHNEPRGGQYYGSNWIGPTIMKYGSDAQKEQHLKAIAAGDGRWAQGYSEPDAGSDLASLRLRAERVTDGWRLSGQKIWTSYGDYAQWIILLARTSADGDKHDGITVFLLPMDREGIEVRPIKNITGPHDFNEVFFDDVYAADSEVLGQPDRGWEVARTSLGFERVGNPRWARVERLLTEVRAACLDGDGDSGTEPDSGLVARWVEAAIGCRVARLVHYKTIAEREAADGSDVSPLRSSVFRAINTANDQRVMDVLVDCVGPAAWFGHGEQDAVLGAEIQHEWRMSRTATVAAGTYEVQQMVIARETLAGKR
jgi:alkylation response protein AidB-like acyl-CoA dehydrogenase